MTTNQIAGRLMAMPLCATFIGIAALGAHAADADRCEKLYRLTDLAHAIEPGAMVAATGAVPAHCRVRGVVNRAIHFQVTLPADWNGRMMFTAVGGGAGVIGDTTSLLARGFAQASTDTGHRAIDGNAYLSQPEALLDYAYRGVHLATVAAKRVIAHYYGKDVDYAYLTGCSNGGRAAMLEAIRFPNDYDGIIAGAPAFRFQEFLPWMVYIHRAQTANPLDRDALVVLDNASRTACDALDGVEDGVIGDPRQCTEDIYDLDALLCDDGETEGCLTAGQIETARLVYEDMVDVDGNVLSPGVPPGGEASGDWAFWMLPNEQLGQDALVGSTIQDMLARIMAQAPDAPPPGPTGLLTSQFDVDAFDPTGDRHSLTNAMRPFDVTTGDLSEFRDQGGKLLMYQGWNDFPLRPQRALAYLADVEAEMGGARATRRFFRLFMAPGMAHCAGGPGAWQADYVDPLVAWREEGTEPDRIIATQPGHGMLPHLAPDERVAQTRVFTRPLCVHPWEARYDGEGDPADAASFRCVAP